ncbi:outer membrane lipoprotein carrier protein LolA [Oceanicaulis sp. LC35]|uniref:LolA family protein n=1 Tax=Oceanicaulis sp. LC35 TaxID=3349635 RepID=UPI003F8280CB
MNTTAFLLSAALTLLSGAQQSEAPAQAAPEPLPEAQAVEPAPGQITPEAGAERAQAWLEGLDTLRARFIQIAADNSEASGLLEIDRPGKARFDYDAPNPVLMVADGSFVAVADFDLETIDRAPIGETPLRFLLDADLDLAGSGAVVDAGRYDGRLYVTLEDPEDAVEGRLTLVFEDARPDAAPETMTLAGWYTVDAMGGMTEVSLSEVETGVRISPRQFILDDEDVMGGDRRRRGR